MATSRQTSSGSWEFTIKRKHLLPKPVSLRFPTKAEGDRYCAQAEALLDKGLVPEGFLRRAKQADTLHAAIRAYAEKVNIKHEDVELLGLWMKECPANLSLLSVDFHWCNEQITRLKQVRNLAPGTIRKRIGALSRCLTWHVALGHLIANPLAILPKGYAQYTPRDRAMLQAVGLDAKDDEIRNRRLTANEEEMITALLQTKIASARLDEDRLFWMAASTMFLLALESAMRLSEMVGLKHSHVDIPKRTVFLHKTKNGEPRQVPMSVAALDAVSTYVNDWTEVRGKPSADAYFFPWIEEHVANEHALALASANISRTLIGLFRRTGAEDLLFHDLRHEATSRLHERTDLSVTEIMTVTGHKTFSMMLRYTHLRASTLADKMR